MLLATGFAGIALGNAVTLRFRQGYYARGSASLTSCLVKAALLASLLGTVDHTKAQEAAPVARRVPAAARRPAVPRGEAPTPAPAHPKRAR